MSGKILILENDEATIRELQHHLEAMGHRVVGVCASLDEAIRRIEDSDPDLVIASLRYSEGRHRDLLVNSNSSIMFIADRADKTGMPSEKPHSVRQPDIFSFDKEQLRSKIETALFKNELERQARENRQWLAGVVNSIGDGIIAVDTQGKIQFINPVAQKLTGWRQEEAVGNTLSNVFAYVDENRGEQLEIGIVTDTQNIRKPATNYETLLRSKQGTVVPVEVSINMLTSRETKMEGVVLVFRDISKRREAINEIQRQAKRAQTLAQSASKLNADLDINNVLASVCNLTNHVLNASATTIFLHDRAKQVYSQVAAINRTGAISMEKENPEFHSSDIESLLSFHRPINIIEKKSELDQADYEKLSWLKNAQTMVLAGIFRKDALIGFLNLIFVNSSDFLNSDLELLQGIADQAAISITNANLFEQVQISRRSQRTLAQSLVSIQEAERRHIARELHDHLGQSLTGLQFMLETTKNRVDVERKPELEEIQKNIGDLIGQVREMSLNLRPSMLDDMGLIPTLRWHFERYTKQTGIIVNFQTDVSNNRFSTEIETTAYRIIQEALTNVARYAQVKEAYVGLTIRDNVLQVDVTDKGKGFDSSSVMQKPTSGLGGMRERADLAGGYLTIRSHINQGTQISATLPLTNKPLERRKDDRYSPPS